MVDMVVVMLPVSFDHVLSVLVDESCWCGQLLVDGGRCIQAGHLGSVVHSLG